MAASDQGRVAITPAAAEVLGELVAEHGEILLVQGGGCCDGSAPVCLRADEFGLSDDDVHVADLEVPGGVVPFVQSSHQYTYSRHLFQTIDAEPGFGAEFSLETTLDMRLLIKSRLLTDDEVRSLGAEPLALRPGLLPGMHPGRLKRPPGSAQGTNVLCSSGGRRVYRRGVRCAATRSLGNGAGRRRVAVEVPHDRLRPSWNG